MADQKSPSGKTITVEQYRSALRRPEIQTETLKGLGLNKINRRRTLQDTVEVRGMVHRIRHLVRIVPDKG
jgi:large subunit ribosomal protein L30